MTEIQHSFKSTEMFTLYAEASPVSSYAHTPTNDENLNGEKLVEIRG